MNLKIVIDGPDQILYQWDRGQRLLLHGYEAGTRVDFARCNDNKAVSKYAYSGGEAVFCDIPDALLMDPSYLHGYVYEIDGDRGETVREFMLPVIRRPKPEDYVAPEEVLIWHELEQRIFALEGGGVPTGGGFVAQPDPPEDTSLLWIDTNDEPAEDEDPAPGGYYTPTVSQPDANTMEVAYTPSADGMPEVRPVQVTLPAGPTGETGGIGPQGPAGTTPHIGDNGNWWIGDTDTGVSAGGAGGGSWNKIAVIELQEDGNSAAELLVNRDANGNPFSCQEVVIKLSGKAMSEIKSCSYPKSSPYAEENGTGVGGHETYKTPIVGGETLDIWVRFEITPVTYRQTGSHKQNNWTSALAGRCIRSIRFTAPYTDVDGNVKTAYCPLQKGGVISIYGR